MAEDDHASLPDEQMLRYAEELRELYLEHQSLVSQSMQYARELQAFYEKEREDEETRRRWTTRIRRVLDGGGPTMVFQPIADLRDGRVVGAEALARFEGDPRRTPDIWFQEAWAVGLGVELELVAVQAALTHLRELPRGAFLSVNVSPVTVASPALEKIVADVGGERVVLEVTEHARVEDYDALWEVRDALRARGMRLAVDDAGAGFASLRHILRLGPDIIKLDAFLTRGIDGDPVRCALASALVSFAARIGAMLSAEAIETEKELEALRALGVRYGQGYLIARPGPVPAGGMERVIPLSRPATHRPRGRQHRAPPDTGGDGR